MGKPATAHECFVGLLYSTKLHHKLWWSVVQHRVCSTQLIEIAGVELLHHSATPQLVV